VSYQKPRNDDERQKPECRGEAWAFLPVHVDLALSSERGVDITIGLTFRRRDVRAF
jgi:hypothetical protein